MLIQEKLLIGNRGRLKTCKRVSHHKSNSTIMKNLKSMLSVLAFMLAMGVAVANTWSEDYFVSVWRKAVGGTNCETTDCLTSGTKDCSEPNYNYFSNPGCSMAITPRRN